MYMCFLQRYKKTTRWHIKMRFFLIFYADCYVFCYANIQYSLFVLNFVGFIMHISQMFYFYFPQKGHF